MARQSFEKEKEAFAQAQGQIEQERGEMSAEIGRLEGELAQAKTDLTSERASREQCVEQVEQSKIEVVRLTERGKALEKSSQSLKIRIEEERSRSERLEKTLVELARSDSSKKKP